MTRSRTWARCFGLAVAVAFASGAATRTAMAQASLLRTAITVADVDRSLAFYALLGFETEAEMGGARSPDSAFPLNSGSSRWRLVILQGGRVEGGRLALCDVIGSAWATSSSCSTCSTRAICTGAWRRPGHRSSRSLSRTRRASVMHPGSRCRDGCSMSLIPTATWSRFSSRLGHAEFLVHTSGALRQDTRLTAHTPEPGLR